MCNNLEKKQVKVDWSKVFVMAHALFTCFTLIAGHFREGVNFAQSKQCVIWYLSYHSCFTLLWTPGSNLIITVLVCANHLYWIVKSLTLYHRFTITLNNNCKEMFPRLITEKRPLQLEEFLTTFGDENFYQMKEKSLLADALVSCFFPISDILFRFPKKYYAVNICLNF